LIRLTAVLLHLSWDEGCIVSRQPRKIFDWFRVSVLLKGMKASIAGSLRSHVVLHTKNLAESQALTSHIWSKHTSRVIDGGAFDTTISRIPLGRSWLCHVDCRSSMHVFAEGSRTKIIVYLPLAGSMKISVAGTKFSAVPGGTALIPAATPMEFRATPIRCILLEIPASKLQRELCALGCKDGDIPPMAWTPGAAGARDIARTLEFVQEILSREDSGEKSPVFLRRLESLAVGCLAEAVAARQGPRRLAQLKIGCLALDDMKKKIASCLHSNCDTAELAAYAGLTTRALQMQFLKHFNTTPATYVQEQRLAAARKALRDPGNNKTVTRLASDLGFHHLGRFSTAYRKKFGESPSETLAGSGKRS